jgi:hypothetical protein
MDESQEFRDLMEAWGDYCRQYNLTADPIVNRRGYDYFKAGFMAGRQVQV